MNQIIKVITILFLCLALSNCENHFKKNIVKFESILGERQSEALDMLVLDFEKNLSKVYPDLTLEQGYRQYLLDIKSDTITDWGKFEFQSNKTFQEYYASGLHDEIYDKDTTSLKANNMGKYMEALYTIKDSDSLIQSYWIKREAAGIMQNSIIVDGLLNLDPDFSNYFHKRIVVAEFSF